MNHYDELGVGPDATDEEIKRAYQKRALESHPDHGGDGEEFKKVADAYAVLGDRRSRDHYDRTGESNSRHNLFETLSSLVEPAFLQDRANPVAWMKQALRDKRGEVDAARGRAKADVEKLKERRKAFLGDNGDESQGRSIIEQVLEDRIRARGQAVESMSETLDHLDAVLELVRVLKESDAKQATFFHSVRMATSTNSTW